MQFWLSIPPQRPAPRRCGMMAPLVLISKFVPRTYPTYPAAGAGGPHRGGATLTELDALAFGRGPGSFTGVRIGIGIAQGLALGAELPMIGVSTLATMAQGAWRKLAPPACWRLIDARMGEVYWAEYQRDEQGVWHGEETEAVLKPEAVAERLAQLSGEWATVGTGWQAWPDLAKASGLTLSSGEIELPAAEDMLPLACYLLAAGKP